MIEISNIHFQYPKSDFHLNVDSLKIQSGSKTAVIGPSGFGKTTLLNLMAGISLPDKGEIRNGDFIVNEMNDDQRRNFRIQNIGFVFQDFRLVSYLNVSDNILLPFRINNSIKILDDTRQDMNTLAEDLGIIGKLKKFPDKLSHGERQRVAICRALINNPSLILADEPTGNLDPKNKMKIIDILFRYVKNNKSTLITVTHDHDMLKGFDNVVDFANLQNN